MGCGIEIHFLRSNNKVMEEVRLYASTDLLAPKPISFMKVIKTNH